LQLRAVLRVLRLALDQPFEHFLRFFELALRNMRLGEAAHRREDVRFFVQPRVKRDETLERRRVAGVDAQHAIEEIDGRAALAACDRFLHERDDHLERFVGIRLFEIEIGERLANHAVAEDQIVDNIALLAETTGVFGETAPAVTVGALRAAVVSPFAS